MLVIGHRLTDAEAAIVEADRGAGRVGQDRLPARSVMVIASVLSSTRTISWEVRISVASPLSLISSGTRVSRDCGRTAQDASSGSDPSPARTRMISARGALISILMPLAEAV